MRAILSDARARLGALRRRRRELDALATALLRDETLMRRRQTDHAALAGVPEVRVAAGGERGAGLLAAERHALSRPRWRFSEPQRLFQTLKRRCSYPPCVVVNASSSSSTSGQT